MDTPTVDELLEMVTGARQGAVVDAAVHVAEQQGLDAVIALLAGVQHEVGVRWHNLTWSVADEHAATATIDYAFAAAALSMPRIDATAGAIVVACAEEEWHVLPARMLTEQLRARGWDAIFLGGSVAAEHLNTFVTKRRPVAVAISCSIPIHMPGARRSVAACHAAGVPVIAGGAGFGGNPRRAQAIGADSWAKGADAAHTTLSSWSLSLPQLAEPGDDTDQRLLAADRHHLVDAAMGVLAREFPPLTTEFSEWQRDRTREDFDYMLRFVEAALLTGDDNIVLDFAQWLTALLTARGLPPHIVPLSARCLLDNVAPSHRAAARVLGLVAERDRPHDAGS